MPVECRNNILPITRSSCPGPFCVNKIPLDLLIVTPVWFKTPIQGQSYPCNLNGMHIEHLYIWLHFLKNSFLGFGFPRYRILGLESACKSEYKNLIIMVIM